MSDGCRPLSIVSRCPARVAAVFLISVTWLASARDAAGSQPRYTGTFQQHQTRYSPPGLPSGPTDGPVSTDPNYVLTTHYVNAGLGTVDTTVTFSFPATLPPASLDATGAHLLFDQPFQAGFSVKIDWTTPPAADPNNPSPFAFELSADPGCPHCGLAIFDSDHSIDSPNCTASLPLVSGLAQNTHHSWSKSVSCTFTSLPVTSGGSSPQDLLGQLNESGLWSFDGASQGAPDGFFVPGYAAAVSAYEFAPAADLALTVVDPNCRDANDLVCNSEYLVEDSAAGFNSMRLVDDPLALTSAAAGRKAVVTDGVTLLLIQASVPDSTPDGTTLTLNLLPADAKYGVLLKRDGTGASSSVTVPFELKSGGRKWAFAAYRSPADHPSPTTATSVTFQGNTSLKPDEVVSAVVRLLLPPVILVHGVWSDRGSWKGLEPYLRSAGIRVCGDCRPDYGTAQPAPEFDPLSSGSGYVYNILIAAIQAAKAADRSDGIAVTQIDGIGHSMGGVLLRGRIKYQPKDYVRDDNYRQGDFHKIITVGSPHLGTTLADFFLDHACDTMVLNAGGSLTNPTLGTFFGRLGKPIGPAIVDFQMASPALGHLGKTLVPGHAIVGIETAPTSTTEDMLNSIFRALPARDASGNPFTIDEILGGEGKHDTIVNFGSETGQTGFALTQFQGVVHANIAIAGNDVGETDSVPIWDRIIELLRAPLDGNFGVFQPLTPPPGSRVRTNCAAAQRSPARMAPMSFGRAVIDTSQTTAHPGDPITLTLTTNGTTQVQGAIFSAGGKLGAVPGSGPYSLKWVVPSDRMGIVDIFAGTYGPGTNQGGDTSIIVQPPSAATSIAVTPSARTLEPGEPLQLYVTGSYNGIAESNITSSTAGTTYLTASGGTSVISVDSEGLVTPHGAGTDTVVVINGAITVGATVTVLEGRVRAVRHPR